MWKHYLPPLGAGNIQCRCTKCGRTPDVETPFCAWCGAPMTDEAVQMVMERLRMRPIDADMLQELYNKRIFDTWNNQTAPVSSAATYADFKDDIDSILTIPQPSNEPLTLEELWEMNEEPVWVQNLEEPGKSQWRLLYWDRGKHLVL